MNVEVPDGIIAVRPHHSLGTALGRVLPVTHDLPQDMEAPLSQLAANGAAEGPEPDEAQISSPP